MPKKGITTWQAMDLVWDVVFAIALPTTIFALGGRWLDQRWQTSPLFLLIGLVMSLIVAFVLILRKAKSLQMMMRDDLNHHD